MDSTKWAPLPQRRKKKNHESKIYQELKDIFGSKFDDDVMISVLQSFNYNRKFY